MLIDAGQTIEKVKADALHHGSQAIDKIGQLLGFTLFHAGGAEITVGALIGAFLVLLATVFISRMAQRALERYATFHESVNRATLYALSRITHYLLLAIGILFALSVAGIPVARFTVFAGALGVGLGFGLQAIFNNFVSGLIILFDRTLKVGDFVELATCRLVESVGLLELRAQFRQRGLQGFFGHWRAHSRHLRVRKSYHGGSDPCWSSYSIQGLISMMSSG